MPGRLGHVAWGLFISDWPAGAPSHAPPPQAFLSHGQDLWMVARNSFPQAALVQAVSWMLVGLHALAFMPSPLPTTYLRDFCYLFRFLVIYCDWQVLDLMKGGAGRVETSWGQGLPDLTKSESASTLPASGTFLIFQEVLAGRTL